MPAHDVEVAERDAHEFLVALGPISENARSVSPAMGGCGWAQGGRGRS
jgi:hypothetical protein